MAFIRRINPTSKSNPDTGFGVQPSQLGERFVNKDGSFNIRKTGLPFLERVSIYSYLLALSWTHFMVFIFLFYLSINLFFTFLYALVGADQFTGMLSTTSWGHIKEMFFFSTQSFSTVGYGRINPIKDGADIIASIETMMGWLFFALVTGLLYGRFTQPKAYLLFSENALYAPYRGGWSIMFRMVPYKSNHYITNADVTVNIAFVVSEDGKSEYKFFTLKLERSHVDALSMNWTVVHPIDEESPLLNFTLEDMKNTDVELYIQVNGFDHIFSSTVMQRTSYTYKEIVWNAKFKSMFHESTDGVTTIVDLDKLNDYELLQEKS
jgi:inward rectifier potassium channel